MTKVLETLSKHGAAAVVIPVLDTVFLIAVLKGVNPSVAIIGLILSLGSFLAAQMLQAKHVERLTAISVDKVMAERATKRGVQAEPPKKAINRRQGRLPKGT